MLDSLDRLLYHSAAAMRVALLPMKPLSIAKNRLAPALRPGERQAVALAMYQDVIEALFRSPTLDRIAVISADDHLLDHARRMNAITIRETAVRGLNAAAAHGTHHCIRAGATSLLIVLADLPLITSDEIDQIFLDLPTEPHIRLVRSHDGLGTNALLRQPPEVVSTRFGGRSFHDHVVAASEAGVPHSERALPGLSIDVDTIDDLRMVAELQRPTRTRSEVERLGLREVR